MYPHQLSGDQTVSCTYVSRTIIPRSAATSITSAKISFISLTLKSFTDTDAKQAVKLRHKTESTARTIFSILILISSRRTCSPLFSILFSSSPLRPYFSSSFFFSYESGFSCLLFITTIVFIIFFRLFCEVYWYACLVCALTCSYGLQSKTDSVSNLRTTSTMWPSRLRFKCTD